MDGGRDIITVRGVRKTYRGAACPAVDGVTLSIGEGEFFGLLGPNGAGKTTLISILCGMLCPDSGEVRIAGEAVRSCRASDRRRLIGVAPQDVALYEELTARENLRLFGAMYGLGGVHLRDRVEESLRLAALSEAGDRRVGTYSGGMKRRANLAAALVHEPAVLFLDEPTVGIDAQSRNLIFESLGALSAAGMTMVYTTHYMEEAERFCSRIAVLDGGRILALGALGDLLNGRGLLEAGSDARAESHENLEAMFLGLTGRTLRD